MGYVEYKGYELKPLIKTPTNVDQWKLGGLIIKHRVLQGKTKEVRYFTEDTFETKEEAEVQSIAFGMKIIDGEVQEYINKVRDL